MTDKITKESTEHENKLQRIYDAIATLRQQGQKLSVSAVAKKAGIARSTLYTEHPDWGEVLQVIAGKKASPRVQLAEVVLSENHKWDRQIAKLQLQVAELDLALRETRDLSDAVYNQLLAQLHKYFLLASETPRENHRKAEIAKEAGDLRRRLDAALAEVRQLRAERGGDGPLIFAKKEVIDVYPILKRSSLLGKELFGCCFDALNELDRFFREPEFAPTVVYLMCGQFASGKSRWIRDHKPLTPGVVLYIDGTNHSLDMRALFIKRLRSLSRQSRIVACRRPSTLEECLERNGDPARRRLGLAVPEALLRHVDETFCEIGFDEGFDAIELLGAFK